MMKPKQTAVAAGVLVALAGTVLWLSADRPVPNNELDTALAGAASESKPGPAGTDRDAGPMLAGAEGEAGSAEPVALPREPDPNPPYLDLFAGDADGDGRISVEEWLALKVRPQIPDYWSEEEVREWVEKRHEMHKHASSSADPYHYYDDETKIALAEAGDWRAKRELRGLYSRTGRVEQLKQVLLSELDPSDPELANDLMTMGEIWRDRQPLLGAAFIGAAEELGIDANTPGGQQLLDDRARDAGLSRQEMRDAGRKLLAELREGGAQ